MFPIQAHNCKRIFHVSSLLLIARFKLLFAKSGVIELYEIEAVHLSTKSLTMLYSCFKFLVPRKMCSTRIETRSTKHSHHINLKMYAYKIFNTYGDRTKM